MPRVSVLIGTVNAAGTTLPRAIESILGQTLAELEVLVVHDGPRDATEDVVEAYADERLRCLSLGANLGIPRSLNAGMAAARGPIIAIQDDDDWSLPERLERQAAMLEADPTVAVVGCRMREVDERGAELTPRLPSAAGDVGRRLLRFNPIPNTAAAFRRDAALSIGGYDPRYRLAVDYDLWLRLADRHRIVNLPDVLAVRVLGTENFGQANERAMIAETLRMRGATLRRRRTLRGASGCLRPMLSYALPVPVKRALRQARGQAPV